FLRKFILVAKCSISWRCSPMRQFRLFVLIRVHSWFSLGALPDLKADEAANGNVIAELLGDGADVFFDGDFRVSFDEALVHQAVALVKLFDDALNDFVDGLGWFAFEAVGL